MAAVRGDVCKEHKQTPARRSHGASVAHVHWNLFQARQSWRGAGGESQSVAFKVNRYGLLPSSLTSGKGASRTRGKTPGWHQFRVKGQSCHNVVVGELAAASHWRHSPSLPVVAAYPSKESDWARNARTG